MGPDLNPDAVFRRLGKELQCLDGDSIRTAKHYYQALTSRKAGNRLSSLPNGAEYVCACFALIKRSTRLRTGNSIIDDIQQASSLGRAEFIESFAAIYKMLVAVHKTTFQETQSLEQSCLPPVTADSHCVRCFDHDLPCIRLSRRHHGACIICYVKKASCQKFDDHKSQDTRFSSADALAMNDSSTENESGVHHSVTSDNLSEGTRSLYIDPATPKHQEKRRTLAHIASSWNGTQIADRSAVTTPRAVKSLPKSPVKRKALDPQQQTISAFFGGPKAAPTLQQRSDPSIRPEAKTNSLFDVRNLLKNDVQNADPSELKSGTSYVEPCSQQPSGTLGKRKAHTTLNAGFRAKTQKKARRDLLLEEAEGTWVSIGSDDLEESHVSKQLATSSELRASPALEETISLLKSSSPFSSEPELHHETSDFMPLSSGGFKKSSHAYQTIFSRSPQPQTLYRETRPNDLLTELQNSTLQIARNITSYVTQRGCPDTRLRLRILDLNTRLRELDSSAMDDDVIVIKHEEEESPLRLLQDMVLEAEKDVVAHVKQNGCQDVRLKVMIMDLDTRLSLH